MVHLLENPIDKIMTISESPTNLEEDENNKRISVSLANKEEENRRTVSSWFVLILGKVGFYNKTGVVFLSMFTSALQVYATHGYFMKKNWDSSAVVELFNDVIDPNCDLQDSKQGNQYSTGKEPKTTSLFYFTASA